MDTALPERHHCILEAQLPFWYNSVPGGYIRTLMLRLLSKHRLASDTPKDLSMHTTDKGVFTKLNIDRA